MPPISFPGVGSILVTASTRALLETSGLTGYTFKPVKKARIVEYRWEVWDTSAAEPAEYPLSGQPEDYILDRPHNEATADQLGPIWEVEFVPTAQIVRSGDWIRLLRASWNSADLFRAGGVSCNFASERAREWFDAHLSEYVSFRKVDVA